MMTADSTTGFRQEARAAAQCREAYGKADGKGKRIRGFPLWDDTRLSSIVAQEVSAFVAHDSLLTTSMHCIIKRGRR